jgi:hypothetical protein
MDGKPQADRRHHPHQRAPPISVPRSLPGLSSSSFGRTFRFATLSAVRTRVGFHSHQTCFHTFFCT